MRRPVQCADVRLAISAGRDGERSLLSAGAVDRHLTGCPACRSFRSEVDDLVPAFRLFAPRPVPDGLLAMLTGQLPAGGPARQAGRTPKGQQIEHCIALGHDRTGGGRRRRTTAGSLVASARRAVSPTDPLHDRHPQSSSTALAVTTDAGRSDRPSAAVGMRHGVTIVRSKGWR